LQPKSAEAWRALAALAGKRRDWNDPAVDRRAADENSSERSGRIHLSCLRLVEIKVTSQPAEADFKSLISNPRRRIPLAYIQLGLLRTQQKRWADADSLFHQALAHDPSSFSLRKKLSLIWTSSVVTRSGLSSVFKDPACKSLPTCRAGFSRPGATAAFPQQPCRTMHSLAAVELAPSIRGLACWR